MTGHLIHIGYPKAGSTFLQHWFERHPQLDYRPGGVAGVYDVYALARAAASPPGQHRWRVTSSENLAAPLPGAGLGPAEQTAPLVPVAVAQEQACRLLAELFPTATVLVVTRGFRSVALSSYSQYVRTGGDATVEDLLARAEHAGPDEQLVTVDHWDYGRLVQQYREALGPDRVVVLPYELLAADPAAFLDALERRLGLDHAEVARERVNPSLSGVELAWYPRLAGLARRARHRKVLGLYVRLAFTGRLAGLAGLLQRLHRLDPVTADAIPDALLERFRGRADLLRDEPLYEPWLADYLL